MACTELLSIYNWIRIGATTTLVDGGEKVENEDRYSRERKTKSYLAEDCEEVIVKC